MLASSKHGDYLKHIINTLESAGYVVFSSRLNSADFNLCQNRVRLYLVAIDRQHYTCPFEWPAPSSSAVQVTDIMDPVERQSGRTLLSHLPDQRTARSRVLEALLASMKRGFNLSAIISFILCACVPHCAFSFQMRCSCVPKPALSIAFSFVCAFQLR